MDRKNTNVSWACDASPSYKAGAQHSQSPMEAEHSAVMFQSYHAPYVRYTTKELGQCLYGHPTCCHGRNRPPAAKKTPLMQPYFFPSNLVTLRAICQSSMSLSFTSFLADSLAASSSGQTRSWAFSMRPSSPIT